MIQSPSYFQLWLAQLLSSFGDTLHYVALVVLVFQLTGEGITVAGLAIAEILPVLLLGPVAGVLIDRARRKSVLISADLFRAGLVLSLLWPQGAWHAYLVAAGNVFFKPTVQAVIPVLTTPEKRLAANSVSFVYGLNTSSGIVVFNATLQDAIPDRVRGRVFTLLDVTWNGMRLVSLVVGGVAVDVIGIQALHWDGGLLLLVAGLIGLMLVDPRNR